MIRSCIAKDIFISNIEMDFKNIYLVVNAINNLERSFLNLKRNNSNIGHKCLSDLIPFNCHCVESVCIAHSNTDISQPPPPPTPHTALTYFLFNFGEQQSADCTIRQIFTMLAEVTNSYRSSHKVGLVLRN